MYVVVLKTFHQNPCSSSETSRYTDVMQPVKLEKGGFEHTIVM